MWRAVQVLFEYEGNVEEPGYDNSLEQRNEHSSRTITTAFWASPINYNIALAGPTATHYFKDGVTNDKYTTVVFLPRPQAHTYVLTFSSSVKALLKLSTARIAIVATFADRAPGLLLRPA